MSEEAERWKEKYLSNLEDQEKLQRRWDARLDLLRRGLVRSTLAAEGNDSAVDKCMAEMRDIVRRDDMDGPLAALLPRLEKAVLDSEQYRETRVNQMSSALTSLVSQLQALPLPKDVSKPLKAYAKHLDSRVGQSREMPLLLSELSALQNQALVHLETPAEAARPGLLQRLFGGRDEAEADTGRNPEIPASGASAPVQVPVPVPVPVPHTEAAEPLQPQASPVLAEQPAVTEPAAKTPQPVIEPVAAQQPTVGEVSIPVTPEPPPPTAQVSETTAEDATATATAAPEDAALEPTDPPVAQTEAAPLLAEAKPLEPGRYLDSLPVPIAMSEALAAQPDEPETSFYGLPASVEPTYSSVSRHIESTLLGLLDDLDLPEPFHAQASSMRTRLEKGLNWYELLPILDDLAVLVLAISNNGQHEFEAYLKQLNGRLMAFQSTLQQAHEDYSENLTAAREMDSQLRVQVGDLHTDMQDAADLEVLKQVLEKRLDGLLGTMDEHQHRRDAHEKEVAERLQTLVDRVANMEQEAQNFRENIEIQRQKALLDTLTGLPNRAAWAERLDQEVSNWQQDGSDLLLAVLDLDHFKRINDNYGHLAGDKVLKIIAHELSKRLRPTDFIARFGGEEFVLLLPASKIEEGHRIIDRLRSAIEACPFHFKGERVVITVSAGVTAFQVGERAEPVFERADQALYKAKHGGRNRVEVG